ncbi:hypothetical protein KDH_66560 [Dictyobacter sp. S3.2.2.5]|uniref:site-specific DNA-methyltransferase (adenine-specific) n=2 Tax=Dictyobacter halimunensis TaxID=3026934 RepID=A0ABQ6G5C1_9CHLR|nr:hypothetical protein KDH_66560 [Dictyobacter sp. S3.2.2.5]
MHTGTNVVAPSLYGEEVDQVLVAWALSNMNQHGYENVRIIKNDALLRPGFVENNQMLQFDYVVASPLWNQKGYSRNDYCNDNWNRFRYGIPHKSFADLGWLQHVLASLNHNGKAVVMLDRGVLSRGSNAGNKNNVELTIRSQFLQEDKIECVILLPYKKQPCALTILDNNKITEKKGWVFFINALIDSLDIDHLRSSSQYFQNIENAYHKFEEKEGFCRVVKHTEISHKRSNIDPYIYIAYESKRAICLPALATELGKKDQDNVYRMFSYGIYEEPRQDTIIGSLPQSWRVLKIKEIALDLGSGNPQRKVSDSDYICKEWVQILDLNDDLVSQTVKMSKYSSQMPILDRIRPKHTVMIAKSGSAGKVGILDMPATTNTAIFCIVTDKEIIDPYYLLYYLKSGKNIWSHIAFGTRDGASLTNELIAELYIPIPSLREQKSIVYRLKSNGSKAEH